LVIVIEPDGIDCADFIFVTIHDGVIDVTAFAGIIGGV
jgi:hypothetical protein